MAQKPLAKTDAIEGANGAHRPLVVHQASHDRAGAESQGIAQLVDPIELRCGEKGLEAVERSAEGKAKIQLPEITTFIDKQMGVIFGQQIVESAHLAHQRKEIGVVEE